MANNFFKTLVGNTVAFAKKHKREIIYILSSVAAAAASQRMSHKEPSATILSVVPAFGVDLPSTAAITALEKQADGVFWDDSRQRIAKQIFDIAMNNPTARTTAIMTLSRISAASTWSDTKEYIAELIKQLA